jgi:transcription initiation factor TFIIH subunit 1
MNTPPLFLAQAVHRAYENMVPLELSDEQFWRKYLESEYFHRDRGRMGTAALNHAGGNTGDSSSKGKTSGPTMEEQDARAAAVGTDDLFSRYDQKLQAEKSKETAEGRHRRWGTKLAVGQFDLACTMETERGKLLQGPRDNHPPNQSDDGRGARVVEKYNRHWAMVLHPDEAHAGSDLLEIARKSAKDVLEDDDDAKPGGGVDVEMRRLVDFASTNNDEADHAAGQGLEGADFEPLELSNIDAYYTGQTENTSTAESDEELAKRHVLFAKVMAAKTKSVLQKATMNERDIVLAASCFPPPAFGYEILSALTKKMAMDSKTEAASLEMVNQLPEDFREKLLSYFRRSSELLRHFFGLRRLEEQRGSSASNQKLARIVLAMESFYREMEGMRKELSQTSTGELMRKMCLPIMDQLDWAFKLHREGSGGGGGGGFVDVEN